jgi:hypothetical protein
MRGRRRGFQADAFARGRRPDPQRQSRPLVSRPGEVQPPFVGQRDWTNFEGAAWEKVGEIGGFAQRNGERWSRVSLPPPAIPRRTFSEPIPSSSRPQFCALPCDDLLTSRVAPRAVVLYLARCSLDLMTWGDWYGFQNPNKFRRLRLAVARLVGRLLLNDQKSDGWLAGSANPYSASRLSNTKLPS